MVAIGILGLDTSHAEAFARVVDGIEDASVAAVWDGGDVRGDGYAREFADRYEASLYDDPHGLVGEVDGAMVLTVDWDTHATLAVPFLEAGVPTLVDKPLAGQLSDLSTLAAAADGTPLLGGSAVPHHPTLAELSTELADHPGGALYGVGCNHPFYYGAHLVDVVRSVVDADWHAVAPAEDPGATVDVVFADDTYATLRMDGPDPSGGGQYHLLSTDPARSVTIAFDEASLRAVYESYVGAFLDAVRNGDEGPNERVLDAGRLLLAVHAALDSGQVVTPDSDDLDEFHADGRGFLDEYRS